MSQPTNPAPASIPCPHCHQDVRYYDAIHSAFFGCPHCLTFFEYPEIGHPKTVSRFKSRPSHTPALVIGVLGQLPGGPYRVTGYMRRCEARHKQYQWEEFQLRQEQQGTYAQLAVYQGHWLFIEPTPEQFKPQMGNLVETPDTSYALYNRYSPRIEFVEGEFDWNVLDDEKLTISEYISPPLMLIQEKVSQKQSHWYRARHLEPQEVATAFGLTENQLPYRSGVGAVQPAPNDDTWPQLRTFSLLMALLVVATHLFLMVGGNQTVFNKTFLTQAAPPTPVSDSVLQTLSPASLERQPLVSPSFLVPGRGALTVDLRAYVSNNWVEVPFTLVNEQTGQQFAGTGNLEYYFGREDGESWSEGSPQQELLLNKVPAGRYHLNFYPTTDPYNTAAIEFKALVQARATAGSNAFLALGLLLLYPIWVWFWRRSHEQSRWENSDYNPYASS